MDGGDLITDYLAHLRRRNLSPRSVALYRSVLRRADADSPLGAATNADLSAWLDTLPLAPRARYTYISTLAGFYRWAVRTDRLTADPTVNIERPRLPRRMPRPIPSDDLAVALEMADARMRLWLCLAAYQGLRCQEIAGVQVDDISLGGPVPVLVVSQPKGGRERVLPLHAETVAALRSYGIPRAGFVFLRQDRPGTAEPVKAHTVSSTIAAFLRGLGIEATAHRLRHWFGTSVYAKSLDLRLTQELLGHADPSTTAGYVQYAQHRAAEVIDQIGVPSSSLT